MKRFTIMRFHKVLNLFKRQCGSVERGFCLGVTQFWAPVLAPLFASLPPEPRVVTSLNFSFFICKMERIIPVFPVVPRLEDAW